MEKEIKKLKDELKYQRVINFILVFACGGIFFYSINTNNAVQSKLDEVDNRLISQKDNINRLYLNDSIIVANQKKIQEKNNVTSFASLVLKALF